MDDAMLLYRAGLKMIMIFGWVIPAAIFMYAVMGGER